MDTQEALQKSLLMRKKQERESVPKEQILASIEQAHQSLGRLKQFIEECYAEPSLVLTQAKEEIQSSRSLLFQVFGPRNHSQLTPHDMMATLASLANQFFQQWLLEHQIDKHLEIRVRNPQSFPSIFAVYNETHEIMQLNIFEKWYGIRVKAKTEEEITQEIHKSSQREEAAIQESKTVIGNLEAMAKQPQKHVKGIKDVIVLLFQMKKLQETIQKSISREEKIISESQQRLENILAGLPDLLNSNRERLECVTLIEPFFSELGYRLEENESLLY